MTVSPGIPTVAYPRPDFQRRNLNWASLDGAWDFIFDDSDGGLSERWQHKGLPAQNEGHGKRQIQVPYAFQFPASGIGLHEAHEVLWYERVISDIRTPDEQSNRLILRFGAVDYECSVWVDGQLVGGHQGGHVPFDLDISDVMSIYYTPTSGIWLSVWMESVAATRLGCGSYGTVLRSDDIANGQLHARVAIVDKGRTTTKYRVEIEVSLAGNLVSRAVRDFPADRDSVQLDLDMKAPGQLQSRALPGLDGCWRDGLALWEPEHPVLYDLTLRLYSNDQLIDEVCTSTGMRSISWTAGNGTFQLNGKPFFQALVLDQGYWPETGMTPPSPESHKLDIELSMAMGFNGCRKHQKVEDPAFFYWADRLGYLVWGEMANAYEFADDVERFNNEWTAAVKRDINRPCIVTWAPGNESWGYTSLKDDTEQRNHIRSLYYMTKTLDPSRPVNDNCGWEHVLTDLTTYHDYADSAELTKTCAGMEGGILAPKAAHDMFTPPIFHGSILVDEGAQHRHGAPVICTEFGGVNIAPASGTTAGERDWGYTTASDSTDLLARLEKLVMAVVRGGHSCGFVSTQLYDVEKEVNGLYSYDRRAKIPAEKVKAILDEAQAYYYKHVAPTGTGLQNGQKKH
ncbi:Beta-galactosidase [Penicillium ucsense]|uniref:Beta-galactosidase n=1 Tax=Penicillium ucsense TaxID=2839758 RepID=A0A8J8VZZ9_9EURO|nr:Beta-galactosidase [Penicillium ucsense]KAF7734706.1 Beta-galactosidase [Penicillium ucsense]